MAEYEEPLFADVPEFPEALPPEPAIPGLDDLTAIPQDEYGEVPEGEYLPTEDEILGSSFTEMGGGIRWRDDDETAHDTNIARFMDRGDLDNLASDVIEWVRQDRLSRQEWELREAKGIRMLGVTKETINGIKAVDPNAEWASSAVHPGLQKACIQFWARSWSELWPAGGPAKAVVIGQSTPERQEQANRVAGFLNYQYLEKMPSADKEMSQMLYRLPLSGSVFKKQLFDPNLGTITTQFIESGDFVKPYSASDLRTAPRYTHILRQTRNEINRAVGLGVYLNVIKSRPDDETSEHQEIDRVIDDATGQKPMADDGDKPAEYDNRDILYECSVIMDLDDRGWTDPLGEEVWTDRESGDPVDTEIADPELHDRVGIGVPYLVTVHVEEQRVMSIRRHWRETDPDKKRRQDVVEYQFLPGLGGYGFGLLHIAGGLSDAQTGFLRYLLDGCALDTVGRLSGYVSQNATGMANLPPFKMGEFKRIPGNVEDWKKQVWTPDFQWRANNTLETLQYLDTLLDFLVASTESMIGDANKDMPVGTILARIEQATKPFAAIFSLLHGSLARELRSVSELTHDYIPDRYPYAVEGEDREVLKADFDDRVDVRPISDPNVVSATQRMIQAEAVLKGAQENVEILGPEPVVQAWAHYLTTLRVPDHERFMPVPQQPSTEPAVDPLAADEQRKDLSNIADIRRKDAAAGADIKRKALAEQMKSNAALEQDGSMAVQAQEADQETDETAARVLQMAMARKEQMAEEAGVAA